ncbi:histone chaperone asf1b-A-like [Mytilus trossulus]|uniref:histone chaperone asf1b-A-like n=1 Tax=Mytilus trossulus TaxID=6551 RepID=UPI00300706CD
MAKVNICNVRVLDNPSPFFNPFQFEITFECLEDLPEDLEWKIIYVGSAESVDHDQTLDSVLVGPVPGGKHMFVFQAGPPDISKIPYKDAVGVTVVLLTCSYRNKEFIRVGYYVNNEYTDPEIRENPPENIMFEKLERSILATSPRVTRFKIDWDDNAAENGENVPPVQNMDSESNQFQSPAGLMKDVLSSKPSPSAFNTDSISNTMGTDIPME